MELLDFVRASAAVILAQDASVELNPLVVAPLALFGLGVTAMLIVLLWRGR